MTPEQTRVTTLADALTKFLEQYKVENPYTADDFARAASIVVYRNAYETGYKDAIEAAMQSLTTPVEDKEQVNG